jgi:ribonuclease P protein component
MDHEAHLPTEQSKAEAGPRVPRQNEDGRGPQGAEPQKESRTKTADYCLKKAHKLLNRRDFERAMRKGTRLVGERFCLDILPSRLPNARLGITVSTKYGNAPERNRLKRLVREAFRLSKLPAADYHVIPRQRAKGANFLQIEQELKELVYGRVKSGAAAGS